MTQDTLRSLVADALGPMRLYAARNPLWLQDGVTQDPSGVHAWLHRAEAALAAAPQADCILCYEGATHGNPSMPVKVCSGLCARPQAAPSAAENGGKTGHPPGMLQDDSRELSNWLADKPDAKAHARDAAATIAQAAPSWIDVVSHAVRELEELDDATAQSQADALRELLNAQSALSDEVHSCSLFCDRPACIKAQRDEMRDAQAAPSTVPLAEVARAAQAAPSVQVVALDAEYWQNEARRYSGNADFWRHKAEENAELYLAASSPQASPPQPEAMRWLYSHCRAIGMACKSDSGLPEHDIALFTVNLKAERDAALAASPPEAAAVPVAWAITYRGAITQHFHNLQAAQHELVRLNALYQHDSSHRELRPLAFADAAPPHQAQGEPTP